MVPRLRAKAWYELFCWTVGWQRLQFSCISMGRKRETGWHSHLVLRRVSCVVIHSRSMDMLLSLHAYYHAKLQSISITSYGLDDSSVSHTPHPLWVLATAIGFDGLGIEGPNFSHLTISSPPPLPHSALEASSARNDPQTLWSCAKLWTSRNWVSISNFSCQSLSQPSKLGSKICVAIVRKERSPTSVRARSWPRRAFDVGKMCYKDCM